MPLVAALMALATLAGNTVVTAAVTDAWGAARQKFARLLGHDNPNKTQVAERWLAETHEQLTAAVGADRELARVALAQRWEARFADLLDEDPSVEADLRTLVQEIQAKLPTGVASAADHSLAVGGNMNISATSGGVASAVIHGGVSTGNPPSPGPEGGEPGPGSR